METPRSLASGWSGGLPGTGRPSASFSSTSGRLFAEEVERARVQHEGEGLALRRRTELTDARRVARRASFAPHGPSSESETRTPDAIDAPSALAAPGAPDSPRILAPEPTPVPVQASAPAAPSVVETSSTPRELAQVSAPPLASAALSIPALAPGSATTALSGVNQALGGSSPVLPSAPSAAPLAPTGTQVATHEAEAPVAPEASAGTRTAAHADEVLRQIELHSAPGVKRLVLELEPVELGRLSIQLALRSGKLAAIVRAERPEALALLEQRAPELKRLLSSRGLAADELRFELGFRAPAGTRRAGRPASTPSRSPGSASFAGGTTGSIDTYA